MADDKTQLDRPEDDMDKTEAMKDPGAASEPEAPAEAPKKKGVKGKDEWQTVQQPKAKRAAAASTPAGEVPPAAPGVSTPAAPGTAGPVPGYSEMPAAQAPQGPAISPSQPPIGTPASTGVPLSNQLANMGIRDRTAQIAVLAVGGLLVLCCGCSCLGILYGFATSSF